MKPIDANSAAFPCEQGTDPNGDWNMSFEPGMTKREYFAVMALQGMLASDLKDEFSLEIQARCAVRAADALLAELGGRK